MPRHTRHTPHDIERALTALAITGNSHKASEMTGHNARTIRAWATTHKDRYAQIQHQRAQLIDQACIEEFRNIVLNASKATLQAVELETQRLQTGETRDSAASARNLATTAAIAADKIALMEGRPTAIIEHRTADDVLAGLKRAGFIDTTATELPDTQDDTPALPPATPEHNETT